MEKDNRLNYIYRFYKTHTKNKQQSWAKTSLMPVPEQSLDQTFETRDQRRSCRSISRPTATANLQAFTHPHILMSPSQPAVSTLLFSCGCHRVLMHVCVCAFHLNPSSISLALLGFSNRLQLQPKTYNETSYYSTLHWSSGSTHSHFITHFGQTLESPFIQDKPAG